MNQNLTGRLRMNLVNVSPETELIAYIAGAVVTLPFAITGAAHALAYTIREISKVVEFTSNNPTVEYVANNPYESMFAMAGIAALGAGLYSYVERKLHVAKTLEDFVGKAKANKRPVEVQFQSGEGLGNYGENIQLKAGKVRYESIGECKAFGLSPARGKAIGVLSLIEAVICLAEDLEKKGFEVRINGGTIVNGPTSVDGAKKYLAACKKQVESDYAFIIG